MALQLGVADVAFFIYGYSQHPSWHIPASAMHVWLAAAVVQVAVITRGIAKYLFPEDSSPPTQDTDALP